LSAQDTHLTARFAQVMAGLVPDQAARLGVAVSGGGDSMALMHLAQHWRGASVHVATVNHGLRAEAAQEAEFVAQVADSLGLPHTILAWKGWDKHGNLQDAARQARRALLADWARRDGLQAVLLGHTLDDQAETFLMRLARGSGVDGLAAMSPVHNAAGVRFVRPLLRVTRAELRAWLSGRGLIWVDDPSNDDASFDRIKARQALELLAPMGLTGARLSETAARMAEARDVLDAAATSAAQELCRFEHGDFVFDAPRLDALAPDTRHRLVAQAVCDVASNAYRPRLSALRAALARPAATLHGCLLTRSAYELRITRELNAVRQLRVPLGAPWDTRWRIFPPDDTLPTQCLEIAPLAEDGLALCPDRTNWHLPRLSLLASPAIWHGTRLIAAPLAGFSPEWQISIAQPAESWPRAPYSH
jgi:tRNA(Ile)-lysidine synthase